MKGTISISYKISLFEKKHYLNVNSKNEFLKIERVIYLETLFNFMELIFV